MLIASRTQRANAFHLCLLKQRIDPQHVYLIFLLDLKTVYANHHLFLRLDRFLITIRRLLYLALHVAGLDRTQHPAHRFDFLQIVECLLFDLVSQLLDRVRTRQRVGSLGNSRFVSNHLLRSQRYARRGFSRQRERFVHRVSM